MAVPQDWFPQSLTSQVKDEIAAKFPNDDHAAASAAWEHYAATLAVQPPVTGVSTGAQSINYGKGWSEYDAAMERADWHRSRMKAYSLEVGGRYRYGWDWRERDQVTYPSPPMPPTGPMQINLPGGTVGPKEMK